MGTACRTTGLLPFRRQEHKTVATQSDRSPSARRWEGFHRRPGDPLYSLIQLLFVEYLLSARDSMGGKQEKLLALTFYKREKKIISYTMQNIYS